MKYLKSYNTYQESLKLDVSIINVDINESLGVYYENILKSIGAEEVNIFDVFSLPKDQFVDKLNLDVLTANPEFIHSLSSIGLKKSGLQNTDELETFASKPCRFMLIYRVEANELENPDYIIFQSWNETIDKWDDTKLYKMVGKNIQKFYDKLSSRIIEIDYNGEKYLYQSDNKNEWILQNNKESDKFRKYFRKEEFEKFINDNKFKINII